MSQKNRKTSDLVSTIPLTYDDETVAEQPLRPRFGDMWITAVDPEAGRKLRVNNEAPNDRKKPLTIIKLATVKETR